MKKFPVSYAMIMLTSCLLIISSSALCSQVQNFPATINDVHQWVKKNFAKGKIPPFSFVYGGKSSNTFITGWQFSEEKIKPSDPNVEKSVCTYSDRKSGLCIRCFITCFNDFPAVEWTVTFSNTSGKGTPLLEKTAVIDHSFSFASKDGFILHYARGSSAERSDFQPIDEKMQPGKSIYMTPAGGRSSDNTAFPFFNVEAAGEGGIMAAVGWTGKWYATVSQTDDRTMSLLSGMEKMKLTLYPGEEIRTPEICLLFWKGSDRMTGHNQFRRFILAHHSRMINGNFAEYPLSGSFDYGDPAPCNEYNCLTEEYAVALVKRYQQFNVTPELFWLDAGWYKGCGWNKGDWWQNVGNWTVDEERFPRGLKPVSDAAHAVGSKFMVWFEPERVRPGTMIDREHPEWLIKIQGNDNALFNLGDKNARIWLTDYISGFLKKEGIDNYRQDFNFDPMPFWTKNDQPDRTGISEIRHIEGLYAFWDSLLVRFPNLLIDNCASGGRRLDLETVSRSAPLWRTDYQYGEPNGYQCHTYGLHFYLPIHGTAIYKTDNYTFRSGLGTTAVLNWEVTGRSSEPIPAMQEKIRDYKSLRPYYYGDYYPLTDTRNYTLNNVWLAYQLNRPEQKDGIIVAFRREESTDESIRVKPGGLKEQATYELSFEDNGLKIFKTGKELMDGIDLTIPRKPASLLIRYKESLSDADARQDINNSIAKYRKGELIVKARPGSKVTVEQIKHEFWFGCAISNSLAGSRWSENDMKQYREKFLENFNSAVTENAVKWGTMEPRKGEVNYAVIDTILRWTEKNHIPLRGHNLFWGIPQFVQQWVKDLNDNELRQTLQNRAETVTSRYKGRFAEYDLNNEMIHGNYYEDRLGPDITKLMAQWSHNGDPDAKLFVNDYDILTGNRLDDYMAHIRKLLKQGVPVAGIGVQGHLHAETFDRNQLKRALDSLAIFKLPIRVTEFNMPGQRSKYYINKITVMTPEEEEVRAKELTDYYRICFAHPAIEGILMWGFWEGANWIPVSSLYKRDWSPTPAAIAYRDLLFSEWWTKESGTAGNDGTFSTRAFYGKYKVTVNGVSKEVDLTKSAGQVIVNF